MPELGIFLFAHLGFAGLIVLFGVGADYIASRHLKDSVVRWSSVHYRLKISQGRLRVFLQLFLDGYLHRIFDDRLFSPRFFARSALTTLLFLIVIVCAQLLFSHREPFQQFVTLADSPVLYVTIILTSIGVNILIDYISNIQSLSLLRMAALSGKLFDIILIFFADLALTVALFTILFPLSITASIVIYSIINYPITLAINQLPDWRLKQYELQLSREVASFSELTGVDLKVHPLELHTITPRGVSYNYGSGILIVIVPKDTEGADVANAYISMMQEFSDASIQQKLPTDDQAVVKVSARLKSRALSVDDAINLFNGAYYDINENRTVMADMILLSPMYTSLALVADWLAPDSLDGILIKCADQKTFEFVPGDDIDNRLKSCKLEVMFGATSIAHQQKLMRVASLLGSNLSVTPFFLTSFAISILYYFIIVIFVTGLIAIKLTSLIINPQYFNVSDRPFTVLSMASVPIIFIITHLIAWLS